MSGRELDLEGKVALVTGAGSGIGRATAELLAERGAKVLVADVDDEGGAETVAAIRVAAGEAEYLHTDVSDEAQVVAMVRTAVDTWGRLDCAVNNAGILGSFTPTADADVELFDRIIAVNLRGVFLGMRHEIPAMLASGGGSIVNTSSAAGIVGVRGLVGYTASKHAVNGMTKVAGAEYAGVGVRVNCVNPGGVDTPMVQGLALPEDQPDPHPIGRSAQPREIAEAIAWLCSDEASFVTGHALACDGGLTVV